ncbi:MAG TPA: response regulator [Pyrinomonadaceae bacterium]|nr:response regulator [Pyrinomonadaceae bacterium]
MATHECLPVAIVAESDEETRALIRSLLEFLGFAVVEAHNGQEVYEFALCYQPDLILIELKLPIVSGFSAIRRIKKESDLSKVPIIALCSRNTTTTQNLLLAAGCSAHVQKPIEFGRLEALVEDLVPCDRLANVSVLVH